MAESEAGFSRELLDGSGEKSTRARILDVSIDLFAQKGFDAVSMQEIASAVGIKKASLYYHFSGKDQILEEILKYPMDLLSIVGPQDAFTEERMAAMGLEAFMDMSTDVVLRWLESPYVEKILRIIFVELYHSPRIKEFFAEFVGSAEQFWTRNFAIFIKHQQVKPLDPQVLAAEYLSFYSHTWVDYFLHRYGETSRSFREEHGDGIDRHTRFLVSVIKA